MAPSAARFAAWQMEYPDWTGADLVARLAAATGIHLVRIAPGEFTMGDKSDGPAHQVTISRPFFLGAMELTQAQWVAVVGKNPSHFKGDTLPVENVSYDDALAFCKKLTEREWTAGRLPAGWVFTLPTEAQWEFACRAETTGDYAGELDVMAWYDKNSGKKIHPVGPKKANAWGLYDMYGNVWEWCIDWYAAYSRDSATDPTGPPSGSDLYVLVSHGGCWWVSPSYASSAYRNRTFPGSRNNGCGFRLALSFTP